MCVGECISPSLLSPYCCCITAKNDLWIAEAPGPQRCQAPRLDLMEYRASHLNHLHHHERKKAESSFHFSPGKVYPGNVFRGKFLVETFSLKNSDVLVAGQNGAAGSRNSELKNFCKIGTFVALA